MASNDQKNQKEIDKLSGIETTGHEWDGLKELNNPLPRWWLWVFFLCIIFAVGYWFIFPAWPTLEGHTGGSRNWSEYSQLKDQQKEIQVMRSKYEDHFANASLQDVQDNSELYTYAVAGGAVAFKNNCAACHGAGGQGARGYPNLNDDEWLWGGSLEQIYTTILYGAHNDNSQTHVGGMPAWKDTMTPDEIEEVAIYAGAMHLGYKANKDTAYLKGQDIFSKNCTSCHGEHGEGNTGVGAPQLNNDIWLYGGDHGTIVQSITYGRNGVMPAWEGRLSDNTIKQLAVYVHSLGGGK